MAKYTTRVELHEANDGDYDKLHKAMEKRGFTRTIKSDGGSVYHLPTAEYDFRGTETKGDVLNRAKAAAATVKPDYSIIVTKSAGRIWHGLDDA